MVKDEQVSNLMKLRRKRGRVPFVIPLCMSEIKFFISFSALGFAIENMQDLGLA